LHSAIGAPTVLWPISAHQIEPPGARPTIWGGRYVNPVAESRLLWRDREVALEQRLGSSGV